MSDSTQLTINQEEAFTPTTDFSKEVFRAHNFYNVLTGSPKPLTVNQRNMYDDYMSRITDPTSKPLTKNQMKAFGELMIKENAPEKLGDGAMKWLTQHHKERVFNMKTEISTKYMDKGLAVEEVGISLYSEVTGMFFAKNKERVTNEWFTGEADNTQKRVRDIKASFDFTTFPLHDTSATNPFYEPQMQIYMDLFDKDTAELIYVLVDTPEMIVEQEIRNKAWKLGLLEAPDELAAEVRHNHTYSHIPPELRIKTFYYKRDNAEIAKYRRYIKMARTYLNRLSEAMYDNIELMKKVA
jgi:hypothetical protein